MVYLFAISRGSNHIESMIKVVDHKGEFGINHISLPLTIVFGFMCIYTADIQ